MKLINIFFALFSKNEVPKTSYQMLEILSFSNRERTQTLALRIPRQSTPLY